MQLVGGQVLPHAMLMAKETPEEGLRKKNICVPKVEEERIHKRRLSA